MEVGNARTFKATEIFRWLSLPFATILGALIVSYVSGLALVIGAKIYADVAVDGLYNQFVIPLWTSGVFGTLYAYIAYRVAPRWKLAACGMMVAVQVAVFVRLIFFIWTRPGESTYASLNGVGASSFSLGLSVSMFASLWVLTLAHRNPETLWTVRTDRPP